MEHTPKGRATGCVVPRHTTQRLALPTAFQPGGQGRGCGILSHSGKEVANRARSRRDGSVTSALTYLRKGVTQTMVLAVILPGFHEGILKTIFIDTAVTFSVLGQPAGGFHLTLLDLVIIGLLAFAVTAITEWLTGRKIGNLFAGMVVTIIGALLVLMFVRLPAPLDFAIEDVAVVAALIGAIIVGVFYALIRARASSSGRAAPAGPSQQAYGARISLA